ncbi:hypothetical protein [Burkholderia multivorans]|uniref:hypothetical protein n=1 Tax=Burkholderia multivorans TaxID=87883 RepID=UPI000CFFA6B7|nr:hypothetical protein [Burkholderia multivorans]PRF55371.1 hypothetical protein C6Q11_05520 [Burkholderia multivorans]
MSNETTAANAIPESITIGAPNIALIGQSSAQLKIAESYVIDHHDIAALAAQDLAKVKELAKSVEAERRKITDPLNAAVKAVNDLFRPATTYLEQAERVLKSGLLQFNQKVEAENRARQAQAEAAARAERERMEAEAKKLAEQGQTEAAEVVRETAQVISAPIVAAPAVKIAGIQSRGTYKARVTDKMKLIQFVAAHPEFEHLLDANTSQLNQLAKAMKEKMQIDGVESYREASIASRAAA